MRTSRVDEIEEDVWVKVEVIINVKLIPSCLRSDRMTFPHNILQVG